MTATVFNEYRNVILGGALGERFGKVHRLVVQNAVEALKMLALREPEFKSTMIEMAESDVDFHIMDGDIERTIDDIKFPATGDIVITPIPQGAAKTGGILETIAGVALLVVSYFFPPAYAGYAALVGGLGASLALSGITSLLTTVPKSQSGNNGDFTSFYFSGATNTQTQGAPVPLVYGRMLTGAQPVYAAMTAMELADAPAEVGNLT